jgi:hypothetical protein
MPAFRGKRIRPLQIKRDIKRLMDMFPRTQVHVERLDSEYTESGERDEDARTTIYRGEALVRPVSGDTEGYGLGTVENQSLVILINGAVGSGSTKYLFRQGDLVTINDGRDYEVELPPVHLDSFVELRLGQRSQIQKPV